MLHQLQAFALQPELVNISQMCGVAPRRVWERACEEDEKLAIVTARFQQERRPKEKTERLATAKKYHSYPYRRWLDAVFVDETQFNVYDVPQGTAIGSRGETVDIEVHLASRNMLPLQCRGTIHWFVAVHPKVGLIHFQFDASSQSYEEKQKHHQKRFKVSFFLIFLYLPFFLP